MDKSVLWLLGGASALALASGGALAAPDTAGNAGTLKPAQSFAELLDPIPNAARTLQAQQENTGGEPLRLAQIVVTTPHHHHHHHHHYYRRHHHHHHHHVVIPVPIPH